MRRQIFARYDHQRQWIIEEILSSLVKMSSGNNAQTRFQYVPVRLSTLAEGTPQAAQRDFYQYHECSPTTANSSFELLRHSKGAQASLIDSGDGDVRTESRSSGYR